MNCPKCGSILAPGALFCPVCNEPLASAYTAQQGYPQPYQQPYPYPQQPQPPQQQVYPNAMGGYGDAGGGYAGYQQQGYQYPSQQSYQQSFPAGYQQPYSYDDRQRGVHPLLSAITELPHTFTGSFHHPSTIYRELLERNDILTCPLVAAVMLLLTFLCGMTVMRSFVSVVFSVISTLTGISLAGDAASMNQGISYVTGRIAPAVGGIAALCQLFAILVPALVCTLYLTVFCKLHFSWPIFFGMITVSTFPTVVVALLCMLGSMLSPWLAVLFCVCGMAFSYAQLGSLLSFATGRAEAQLFLPKAACFCLSLVLTFLLVTLIGGAMMGGVINRMLQLLSNVGSLI